MLVLSVLCRADGRLQEYSQKPENGESEPAIPASRPPAAICSHSLCPHSESLCKSPNIISQNHILNTVLIKCLSKGEGMQPGCPWLSLLGPADSWPVSSAKWRRSRQQSDVLGLGETIERSPNSLNDKCASSFGWEQPPEDWLEGG